MMMVMTEMIRMRMVWWFEFQILHESTKHNIYIIGLIDVNFYHYYIERYQEPISKYKSQILEGDTMLYINNTSQLKTWLGPFKT